MDNREKTGAVLHEKRTWLRIKSPEIIMKQLPIFVILFVFSLTLYANASESNDPRSYNKVTNALALKMLKNYQTTKTYHCLWEAELAQGEMVMKMGLEAAFDRKTGKTLFIMQNTLKKDGKWVPAGGQLHVYDGQKVQRAISQMPGEPMKQVEEIAADPNKYTYRDFRKGIAFIYPFDLPLLYPDHSLTEYPLMEILQGEPKEVKTVEPDPKDPAKIPGLELMTDGTCARIHLDPKTLLIKDFVYFHKVSGKTLGSKYKQVSVLINKPFKPGLFDFAAQLKSFNPEVLTGKPSGAVSRSSSVK